MLAERCKLTRSLAAIFLITRAVVICVHAQSTCSTFGQEAGLCVPKLQCKTVTTMLARWPESLPFSVAGYINRTRCGVFDDITYVCCKSKNVISAPESSSQRTPTTELAPESRIAACDAKSNSDLQCGLAILRASKCERQGANSLQHPWFVLLMHRELSQSTAKCTGTLITDRYVLTAAHCLQVEGLTSVRLGMNHTGNTTDCTENGRLRRCAGNIQEIEIEEVLYHTDYNHVEFSNDIGLIRLSTRAVLTANVQPICLPITPESEAITLDEMKVIGLFRKEPVDFRAKADVQNAVVKVVKNNNCTDTFQIFSMSEKQLCVLGGNSVLGRGVAGGPLFVSTRYGSDSEYVQYGILSGGKTSGIYPTIFVDIISYLPWIAGGLRP